MGYLLKEALKSLCGINQWSYAVFWKIGCQNPKLLIWEDCYYEPVTSSALYHASKVGNQSIPLEELQSCWVSPNVSDTQSQDPVGERVRLLIDKMMTNQVHVVGEGLVGRAAFTGAHQWIVSGSYNENAHPPEVVSEINLQFSAGMQTIAVIPIVPHGVVQLGSSLAMTVNIVFVHEVKNLILQLGCISSTLMPDNYMTNEPDEKLGIPVAYNASVTGVPYIDLKGKNCRSMLVGSDLQNESVQTSKSFIQPSNSMFDQVADHLQKDTSGLHISNPSRDVSKSHGYSNQPKNNVLSDAKLQNKGMLGNKVPGTEVIPMLSQALLSQQTKCSMGARFTNAVPSGLCRNPHLMEQTLGCVTGSQGGINRTLGKSAGFATPQPPNSSRGSCAKLLPGKSSVCGEHNSQGISAPRPANTSVSYMLSNEEACLSNVVDQFNTNCMLSGCSDNVCHRAQYIPKEEQIDLYKVHGLPFADSKESTLSNDVIQGPLLKFHGASQLPTGRDSLSGDIYAHSSAGDDLFDVLGKDFKNKLLNGHDSTAWEELGANTNNLNKYPPRSVDLQDMGSSFYSSCRGTSDSGIFSGSVSGSGVASDHLLDAVVSGIHSASRQASDDNVSCHTTVTNISSSSVPSNSGTCGRVSMSSNMEEEFYGCAMPVVGFQEAGIMPIKSGFGKNGTENCSVSSSFYGSKISSWIEQGPSAKRESSISTANSKKPIEAGKTNRKRLKPGENPRPRPKDRQMIQDRVKELREIVPNGAKCSIDALLERTVKHMLFLQSVTKHADKLRQTMESKIISKDGLLLKDNFEGGATWAFEVGSQSMVCPIIVEDLNPPRQLLVEMLCEERGFFLEIADIIRGLGLTILKGIMESRNDKIWARFAVEANRDVTRMEIFISLVHVLEQTVKGSTGLASADNDDNVAVHPTFHHQATSSMPAKEQMVGPVSRSETSAI